MTLFAIGLIMVHDIGFSPRATHFRAIPGEMRHIARDSLQYGWRTRPVRLIMIATFFLSTFRDWGFHSWQPYFLGLLGQDAVWMAGVIAALVSLSTMAGNYSVELLARYCVRRTTLLLWSVGIMGVAAVGVGLASSFGVAVGLYLVVWFMVGVWEPVKQAFLHECIPSDKRATVISFESLVISLGSTLGQVGLGSVAQTRSISQGYVLGGLLHVLALPVLWLLRRSDAMGDRFEDEAGEKAPCAAQGLPDTAAV
jgi:MFS family permease